MIGLPSFDAVESFVQTSGLLYFVAIFAGVMVYVLRPANRQTFDAASRVPLDGDGE